MYHYMEEKHNHRGGCVIKPEGEKKRNSIFMAHIISADSFQQTE